MVLADEFDALIAALEQEGLDYAVVGALAVAIWGAPRATTDIDLLIRPDDLAQAMAVARRCGFDLEAAPMRFEDGMEVQRLTKAEGEDTLTLDLLLVDANTQPIWSSRLALTTESGGTLRVVSRDALIQMKVGAGRAQDIADVERLRGIDR